MLSHLALFLLLSVVSYFFLVTRGTLIYRQLTSDHSDKSHVYWVYTVHRLISLSDQKLFVSAVLLFQYNRLVNRVVEEIQKVELSGKSLLVTSCAFGDLLPKVVAAAMRGGASRVFITDIIQNELKRAEQKLNGYEGGFELIEADATCMQFDNEFADLNILFFLLHELPDDAKLAAVTEAVRLVRPGGKLIIAEFHRPHSLLLRTLGRIYFTVFEPYALTVWNRSDPKRMLDARDGWDTRRVTHFMGNFQVVVATKSM
jgi:ubiquinone/menaquinone biosynthesis C-methylase UbiE